MWLRSFSIIFDKNTFQIFNRHNYDSIFIYHATIPKYKVSLLLKNPQTSIEPNKALMKEEELIKGCIDENNACQRELYDKYGGKMFAVCLRYANTREDAEDALQEAFIRIFDNISKFRGEGSFEGWMRRITVHTVLRLIQKKTPLQYAEDTAVLTKVSTASDAISQLSEKDILGLINKLPQGYKVVFNMYAIEGFSHGEIAENLGISEGTSRSQYSRAKKHLQHFIHKLYHID
jgi:RNA polymerase sigma factor (sigma-70 family)